MSCGVHTPRPAITRSWNTNTPARTSVTPGKAVAKLAVGVEPTLTIAASCPAARRRSAARTTAARSCSAMVTMAAVSRLSYEPPEWVITPATRPPGARAAATASSSGASGARPLRCASLSISISTGIGPPPPKGVRATACAASTLSSVIFRSQPRARRAATWASLAGAMATA